ncbi:uncharacterized protein B0H18DRAFT_606022 [Fomitopsis serialis]|uniref:uncharacterized protein n=1 Tax=Fomitopsis serialis TaxID=139415 RepID=UPI0020078B06|nr:uncharacterized protein B0H18DRAFT_606022 [Neoantrodia serialis]KAH9933914.1 hypothetical protein B0H18DRAFT_606022 [Neoantrodia serialis]
MSQTGDVAAARPNGSVPHASEAPNPTSSLPRPSTSESTYLSPLTVAPVTVVLASRASVPELPSVPARTFTPKSSSVSAEVQAPPKALEEPKGIGDFPSTNGGVCRFFLAGNCIATRCRHSHELRFPEPAPSQITGVRPYAKVGGSTEPDDEPPLSHLPFANVAELSAEETVAPGQGISTLPPKPTELSINAVEDYSARRAAEQNGQPMRKWVVDPRPARRSDEICMRYRRGTCSYGEDCLFTHTLAIDNRRARVSDTKAPLIETATHALLQKLNEVCRLHVFGVCDWGDKCHRTHISPDSPTLVLRTPRSDTTLQSGPESERSPVGGNVQDAMDANASRSEEVPAGGPATKRTCEILSIERPHRARSLMSTFDNRPARRFYTVCIPNLRGRCRYGDECFKTHVLPGPEQNAYLRPHERVASSTNAMNSQSSTPVLKSQEACLNWLFRGTCLNGTSCMYDHPPQNRSSRTEPPVDISSGTVTPMPTGSTSVRGYTPAPNRPPGSLGLYDGVSDVATLCRTPEHLVSSGNLHTIPTDQERRSQGTTAEDLLHGLMRNRRTPTNMSHPSAYAQQESSHLRPQKGAFPATRAMSTPHEAPVPDRYGTFGPRAGDSSGYFDIPSSSPAGARFRNSGPRLWKQSTNAQEDRLREESAQTNRADGLIERGDTSSESSFHSAQETQFDLSVDASQSSVSSFDSPCTPAEPSPPVCWDFLHGKCTRHVCRYLHEVQRDPVGGGVDSGRQRAITNTRPAIQYPPESHHPTKASSARFSSAEQRDSSHESDQSVRVEPSTVPAVPPGLGLEIKRSQPVPLTQRREPPASVTLSVLDSTRVTYGPGFDVQTVVTGFETRQVVLKDLPLDVSPADVTAALKPHGEVTSVYLPDPGKKAVAAARVTFATPDQAANAASAIDGLELFGTTITARLGSGQSSLVGKARLADGDVLLEFPCAHKTAYVGYSTRALAEKAIALANNTELKGNWVTAEIHEGLPMVGASTIRIRGLPASTQVKDLGRYGKVEGVMLERPNYDSSKSAIHRLRTILDNFGSMFSFNVLPPPYKRGTIRAYAQFETPAAAEIVCAALHNRRQPFCGHGKLYATHVRTLVYQLPPAVFDALGSDIRLLNAFIWRTFEPGSSISIADRRATAGPHCPVRVKLAAERMPALTRMKSHFDRLLHGDRVEQDGEIVWDGFFARSAGIQFLEEVQRRHVGVLINRDIARRMLSLFGPESQRNAVRSVILTKMGELKNRKLHIIDLSGRLIGLFWGADLSALQRRFGEENVSLDPVARVLRVRGDDAAHEAALLAVKEARERHASDRRQPQVECPVCFNEVTNPVKLDCGHTWCKTCLQNYLRASVDNGAFPLVCLGDEARCTSPIPIHAAQEILSTNDFMSIVEASFRAYVHSRPSEYHYCPTPDCLQVYRRTSHNTVLQCPSCLTRICPKCNSEHHEGSTCKLNEAGDRILFEEWKSSHDAKDCPSCKAPIEREAGCNHMMCIRCKTHICWACLATFDAGGEVYEHMRLIHGGIGL